MRYFIGYLLSGGAKEYHEKLAEEIAEKFGIPPLHRKIPPHITLKVPFESERIEDAERVLEKYSKSCNITSLRAAGFGHFNERVLFIDISPSRQFVKDVKELTSALRSISWMQFDTHDVRRRFHATIACSDNHLQFKRLWRFIVKKEPSFDIVFDHVAILEKRERRWCVHKEYPFTQDKHTGTHSLN